MDAKQLATFLRAARYRIGTEALLHDDVELHLKAGCIAYDREHRLGPGERLDFLVAGSIALELKIRAQRKSIYRQLERYARHDAVKGLVLVTASALGMPKAIEGKPIYVVQLGLTAL